MTVIARPVVLHGTQCFSLLPKLTIPERLLMCVVRIPSLLHFIAYRCTPPSPATAFRFDTTRRGSAFFSTMTP